MSNFRLKKMLICQQVYVRMQMLINQQLTKEEIKMFDKVKEIIVDSLTCDEEQVTLEADLKADLEADSLDAVELIMAIEDEFSIEIPEEIVASMKTVGDIVSYLENNQ